MVSPRRWLLVCFLGIGLFALFIGTQAVHRDVSVRRSIEGLYTIFGSLCIIIAVWESRGRTDKLQTLFFGLGLLVLSVILQVLLFHTGVIQ